MAELMTQSETPIPALTPAEESRATDHLVQLPKMSPTAGVATQEYVAINVGAVFALLFGFAGILALMQTALMVVPLAAIIIAAVSLRQIGSSNGTQGGGGIATAGLFIAVSITSFLVSAQALESISSLRDKQGISDVCQKFGEDLHNDDFDAAYDLFSARFKSRVSRGDFVTTLRVMQEQLKTASQNGNDFAVTGAKWNGLAAFYTDPDSGVTTAQAVILLSYQKAAGSDPLDSTFRKETITGSSGQPQQVWTIDDIPNLFRNKRPAS